MGPPTRPLPARRVTGPDHPAALSTGGATPDRAPRLVGEALPLAVCGGDFNGCFPVVGSTDQRGLSGGLEPARWVALTGITDRFTWLRHLTKTGAGIPYGIAIAAGGLFVFPATHLFALAASAH